MPTNPKFIRPHRHPKKVPNPIAKAVVNMHTKLVPDKREGMLEELAEAEILENDGEQDDDK